MLYKKDLFNKLKSLAKSVRFLDIYRQIILGKLELDLIGNGLQNVYIDAGTIVILIQTPIKADKPIEAYSIKINNQIDLQDTRVIVWKDEMYILQSKQMDRQKKNKWQKIIKSGRIQRNVLIGSFSPISRLTSRQLHNIILFSILIAFFFWFQLSILLIIVCIYLLLLFFIGNHNTIVKLANFQQLFNESDLVIAKQSQNF